MPPNRLTARDESGDHVATMAQPLAAQTWECHFHTRTGRYYFHNQVTRETRWQEPEVWEIMWFVDSQFRTRYYQERVS